MSAVDGSRASGLGEFDAILIEYQRQVGSGHTIRQGDEAAGFGDGLTIIGARIDIGDARGIRQIGFLCAGLIANAHSNGLVGSPTA